MYPGSLPLIFNGSVPGHEKLFNVRRCSMYTGVQFDRFHCTDILELVNKCPLRMQNYYKSYGEGQDSWQGSLIWHQHGVTRKQGPIRGLVSFTLLRNLIASMRSAQILGY